MAQVPAARNTLRILTLLSEVDVPISAARIIRDLDLPRSSTYHLLKEMESAGYVVRIPGENTYGLGLAAYAMANAYTTQQPLVRLGAKRLTAIANAVEGSTHISRLSGDEIVYLHESRAPGAPRLVTEVGVRLSAFQTASGRIMLAHLEEADLRARFNTSGVSRKLSWSTVNQHLTLAASRGYGEENQEVSKGQRSLAVAVMDHLHRPAAAVAATFPVGKHSDELVSQTVTSLMDVAKELSRKVYGLKLP